MKISCGFNAKKDRRKELTGADGSVKKIFHPHTSVPLTRVGDPF